jgi:hypothetical protein
MLVASLLGAALGAAGTAAESTSAALVLRDHAQLSAELRAIAGAHPELAQLVKLGTSRGGRALEGLWLAAPGAADSPARPAILLVANLDGARVFASAVALEHARALAEGYASDERVRALLDTTTVFVVPRANPDAAEARFVAPRGEQRASGPGVDDDRDGRAGEDAPADLDGDGVLTWLRVLDPDGRYRPDPTDARVLVEAERSKGERGTYVLWPEGRDADGDERVAEDAPFDARVDRNFPAGWEAHTKEGGAFATDEPEARALCDFVLAHPELALVVVYDAQDSLVTELKGVGDDGPAVKLVPPPGVLESDAKLLNELGKRYRAATEGATKSGEKDGGTFARWCYEQRGLFTLSAALWDVPLEEPKREAAPEGKTGDAADGKQEQEKKDAQDDEPKPSDDAKRLRWIDAAGPEEAWRFVPWKAFEHPELGAVEIGGFAPYARLEPPAAEGAALARRHFEWFLSLGELLARVRVAECRRETLGEGVVRVIAVLENDAFLPLLSRSARRTETTRPAKVRLVLPEAARRLSGPPFVLLSELEGSGGRAELTWLVQAPSGAELAVAVESTHAGSDRRLAEEAR